MIGIKKLWVGVYRVRILALLLPLWEIPCTDPDRIRGDSRVVSDIPVGQEGIGHFVPPVGTNGIEVKNI